jgi:hypothetical protein
MRLFGVEMIDERSCVLAATPMAIRIGQVGPQIRIARSEMIRLRGIIDDASNELLQSFGVLQNVIAVSERDWMSTPSGAALARAMTAMQFQDMVGQLMTGVSQRLDVASDLLGDVEETPGAAEAGATASNFPRQVVLQTNVSAGDVELF